MRALEGLVILDLTHMLSGPYGTMLLADLGARTIKVEPPGRGEGTRRLLEDSPDFSRDGQGAYFLTLCRNKESVAIDLKSLAGLKVFYRLVRAADIVVSNFGAGVTEKLKIDYPALSAHNPRIITCSITGFGENGPKKNWPAFDLVAQGMSGGMAVTGYPESEPLRAGLPIGDLGAGMFGAIGILAAIEARHRTGKGQHVDISMLDCQLSLLNYMATMTLMSGKPPKRSGNGHFVHVPYNTFRTATNFIIIAVLTDTIWLRLVDVLGDDWLSNPAFETQPGRLASKDAIEARMQSVLETQPCDAWLELLAARRIPCAPVNEIQQAFDDPQTLARKMKVGVTLKSGETIQEPGNPVKLSETYADIFTPPPVLGADTAKVLATLGGFTVGEIEALCAEGAIAKG